MTAENYGVALSGKERSAKGRRNNQPTVPTLFARKVAGCFGGAFNNQSLKSQRGAQGLRKRKPSLKLFHFICDSGPTELRLAVQNAFRKQPNIVFRSQVR